MIRNVRTVSLTVLSFFLGIIVLLLWLYCNRVTDDFAYRGEAIGTIRVKSDSSTFAIAETDDINSVTASADHITLTGMEGQILGLPAGASYGWEADSYSPEQDAYGIEVKWPNKPPIWLFPGLPPPEKLPEGMLRLSLIAPSDETELDVSPEALEASKPTISAAFHFSLQPPKSTGFWLEIPSESEIGVRTSGHASAYLAVQPKTASDMSFEIRTKSGLLAVLDPIPDSLKVNGIDVLADTRLSAVILISTIPHDAPLSVRGVSREKELMLLAVASDTDMRSLGADPSSQDLDLVGDPAPGIAIATVARDVWISRQRGSLVVGDHQYAVSNPSTVEIRGITSNVPRVPSSGLTPEILAAFPDEALPLELLTMAGATPAGANLVVPRAGKNRLDVSGRSSRIVLNGHNVAPRRLDTLPDWLQQLLIGFAVGVPVGIGGILVGAALGRASVGHR